MKYIMLIILILFTISCSLDRTNPLDPLVSGTDAPNRVTNIHVIVTLENTIEIVWNPVFAADGYYIYRSQTYYGLYVLIEDVENINNIEEYEDHDVDIHSVNEYWYKMSAYIELDEGKLEGYRSEPKTWN